MSCVGCLGVSRAAEVPAALGLTPSVVRRLVKDGVLVRLRQGVLVGACHVERAAQDTAAAHRLSVQALLLQYDDAYASHESAAVVHGVPVLHMPPAPRVTREQGAWRGGDGGRVRIAPLPDRHRGAEGGIRVTSLPRTFVDIARSLDLVDSVVTGDYVLRNRCSQAELLNVLEECASWSDLGKARAALAFLDPRAESPLESVSRVFMHQYDVPTPELQKVVVGASGRRYRADFYWEFAQVIGEADGIGKYGATKEEIAKAFRAEKWREDDLRDGGHGFVRWDYPQVMGQTAETMARIMRRLGR